MTALAFFAGVVVGAGITGLVISVLMYFEFRSIEDTGDEE